MEAQLSLTRRQREGQSCTISPKRFRILSFLQRNTDVRLSDNSQKLLPTHQPISREKQTQIPNICQVLSQIAFPLFSYFQLDFLPTLPVTYFLIFQGTHILQVLARKLQNCLYFSENYSVVHPTDSSSTLSKYQGSVWVTVNVLSPDTLNLVLQISKLRTHWPGDSWISSRLLKSRLFVANASVQLWPLWAWMCNKYRKLQKEEVENKRLY